MSYKVGDPDPTPDDVEVGCMAETNADGYAWECFWDSPHDGDHVSANGDIVLHVWPQASAPKQRTVTTVAELEALPARTFIREYDGFHRLKEINGLWLLCIQSGGTGESSEIELPADVLYVPGA